MIKIYIVGLLMVVEAANAQVVFPLQIGNVWEYWGSGGAEPPGLLRAVRVVGDTVLQNGKQYAVLLDYYGSYFYTFQRQEADKVFQYFDQDSTESILYDFGLNPGEVVTIKNGDTTRFVRSFTYSVFQINRTIYEFSSYDSSFGEVFRYRVADSLGLVSMYPTQSLWYYALDGAIIGGKQYGHITDIGGQDDKSTPSGFSLHSNYPNPFNPQTTISYELPERSSVSLNVYNVLGEHVATLVDEMQDAGNKSVRFDGSSLSSGVYYYRVNAVNNNHSVTHIQKMMLVK